MSNSSRFWPKVGKSAFLLAAIYFVGMSFWCASAGKAFKERELERDIRFHEALDKVAAMRAKLEADGVADPDADPALAAARRELASLSKELEHASKSDLNGSKAATWTAIGALPLLGVHFGIAALIRRRQARKSQPEASHLSS